MRTAKEYGTQISIQTQAIGILEKELFKVQMATPIDWTLQKALRKGISDLEASIKYLSSQRRKAERIEARESESVKKS